MRNRIGLARGGPGRFNEVNAFQGAVQRIIRLQCDSLFKANVILLFVFL
jgi:hypothetical protein